MGDVGFYLVAGIGPFGHTVLGSLWTLIFFAFLKIRAKEKLSGPRDKLSMTALWLLLAVTAVSVFFSLDISLSVLLVLGQFLMVTFGILGGRYLSDRPALAEKLLAVSSVSLVISAVVVIYRSFSVVRAETLFSHVNSSGTILVVFAGLCLPYLWSKFKRPWGQLLAVAMFLVVLWAVLATGSRGALLGYIGMTVVLLGFNKRGLILLLIFAMLLAGLIAYNDYYRHRFTRLSFAQNLDRVYIWQTSLRMIQEHPLVGIGPGLFMERYKEYKPAEDQRERIAYAHNIFLHVGAEYGLPVLAVFVFFIGLVAIYGFKLSLTGNLLYRGLFASFVGAMVHQQVDITAWNGNVGSLFWLLIGLILAGCAKKRTGVNSELSASSAR